MKQFTYITISVLLLVTMALSHCKAQVATQSLLWTKADLSIKLPRKFKLQLETQERGYIKPLAQHQLLFRATTSYSLKHGWSPFIAYTYFLQSPNNPETADRPMMPEHRIMQGFTQKQDYGWLELGHRFQMEERFFRNAAVGQANGGYRFVARWRYRLMLTFALLNKDKEQAKGDLLLHISNEIHLQAGESVKGQPFDQNRIAGGLQYYITNNLAIEAGYTNWYQQRSGGQGFYNRHIITTGISVKLDLSKKHKAT